MYNSPRAVLKGIKTDFAVNMGINQDFVFKPFTAMVKSDSNKEDYLFFDSMPYIKEWLDKIDFKPMQDYDYTIRNKDWAYGIYVDRNTINDSKKTLGADLDMKIKSSVDHFKNFPSFLVDALITANGTAYDGSSFFAVSHNIDGSNAIDNLKSGTTYTTVAGITTDLGTARVAMMGYRDRNAIPININPKWYVLCGPAQYDLFLTLRNAQMVYTSAQVDNIYYQTFDVIVNPWQSATNYDWYLINANASVPAFIYQERAGVEWDMIDNKDERFIKYFATQRGNAGYGAFTSICKVNF